MILAFGFSLAALGSAAWSFESDGDPIALTATALTTVAALTTIGLAWQMG